MKLTKAGIEYTSCDDVEIIKSLGFKAAPMLDVDGQIYNFSQAIKWVNTQ